MPKLFAAVAPAADCLDAVAALARSLRAEAPRARFVASAGYHLTLVFLGEVDEARVDAAGAALAGAAEPHAPFALRFGDLGAFGSPRRPRVLSVTVASGAEPLGALQHDLALALAPFVARPEARAFSPHLTLARARSPRGDADLADLVGRSVGALPSASIDRVTLYESVESVESVESSPARSGARYVARATAPLTSRTSRP